MPTPANTSTSGTSGLSRYAEQPGGSPGEVTASSTRGPESDLRAIRSQAVSISNTPGLLTMRDAIAQQHLLIANQRVAAAEARQRQRLLENAALLVAAGNGLTLFVKALAAEADAATRRSIVTSALMIFAAANTHYWRERLKGPAICLLSSGASTLCSIGPHATPRFGMNNPDTEATITLQGSEIREGLEIPYYRATIAPSGQAAKPFPYAAIQAAQPQSIPLAHTNPQVYYETIDIQATLLDEEIANLLRSNDVGEIKRTLLAHAGLSAQS